MSVDHFETIRRRKDGVLRDISLTISPIKDEHGRIVGASKIARDITQHRRAEKSIQELNAQLTFELSAMERIQRVSTRFVEAGDFLNLLGDIVESRHCHHRRRYGQYPVARRRRSPHRFASRL